MRKILGGATVLVAALAMVHAPATRAEAAHTGAARFASLLHAHTATASHSATVHRNALTPRQEFLLKARIVFHQYQSLRLAERLAAIRELRALVVELREGAITRQEFFADRVGVFSSHRSSALILRARLTATLTALRNDPFGTPATLVR
jgi:hypothetical protein